ncbi:MAG: hypothetical protein JNL69_03385 [Bacteroidia bacterium]|nr:hypothetical protein [Bacteroidia bacterium]
MNHLSEIVFYTAVAISIIALLYTFGALILKDRRVLAFEDSSLFFDTTTNTPEVQLKLYLQQKNYQVLNIIPVSTSNKYIVYALKNNIDVVITAFINDSIIEYQEEKE